MQLELTMEQAQQLKTLLEQSLPEMSHEIAATDNTLYRAELNAYRDRLVEVTEALSRLLAAAPGAPPASTELVRELAHPGD